MTCILGVDPGDVRIGVAVSDALGIIARPLDVIRHTSRREDAIAILNLAKTHQAGEIVVGIPFGLDPEPGSQARKAMHLVDALREEGTFIVHAWDESGSSQRAGSLDSHQPIDALAAAVILQDFLDAKNG
jgi:putative Holliday junction resolvase